MLSMIQELESEIKERIFRQGLLVRATCLVDTCIGGIEMLDEDSELFDYYQIRCHNCGQIRSAVCEDEPINCPHCKQPAFASYADGLIREWWIVSQTLGERLHAEKAPMIICGDVYIWARVFPPETKCYCNKCHLELPNPLGALRAKGEARCTRGHRMDWNEWIVRGNDDDENE